MKHIFRFFGHADTSDHWQIVSEDAHHISKVLKLPAGSIVEATDGQGTWVRGRLVTDSGQATIEVDQTHHESPPPWKLCLIIGALKPSTTDDILPALVELGVDDIVFFLQQGSPKNIVQPRVIERWQRIIRSSVKQCKRATLPNLAAYDSLSDALSHQSDAQLVYAWPENASNLTREENRDLAIVIGSEKGLDPQELDLLAQRQCSAISLGQHILTAATAAIAAAAIAKLA